ncbi:MAG: hypothetical protein KJ052_06125, partial [Candidatus Hydrogenedentes bacterium]|nr:hypothetical protein [Candidatus Hydrogenedentota bacterium]
MISITLITLLLTAPLPATSDTPPVAIPHFPDAVHAFVWRNWPLVDCERMAQVLGAKPEDVLRLGHAMGLEGPPPITSEVKDRAYITIIRRNWHLLPYEQLLELLGWTEEELAYTLREDDFLWIKLGSMKPTCPPLKYTPPDEAAQAREKEIA